jgi:hypothetical protein
MHHLFLLPTTKRQEETGNATVVFRPEDCDLAAEVKRGVFVRFQMDLKFEKDRVMNACKIQWLHFYLRMSPQGEGLDE